MDAEEMRRAVDQLHEAYEKNAKAKRLAIVLGGVMIFALGFLAGSVYTHYATERITIISAGPATRT